MRVQHCTDLQTFYDRVAPFLQRREAEHNMLLASMGDQLRTPPDEPPAHAYYGYVVNEEGEIVAAAHYGGFRLFLSHPAQGYEAAFDLLFDDAASAAIDHLIVPTDLAAKLEDRWFALTGRRAIPDMPMRVYRLETVKPPQVAGTMRWAASPQDDERMKQWMIEFEIETFHQAPGEIDEQRLARWLKRFTSNDVYGLAFWDVDGQPVSMSATIGRSPTGMRIGLVYTPPQYRGHGYASALVAAQSHWLLDHGMQFCTLNTDLANPTSNKIYQAIGYYPVCDQTMFDVEPVAGEESR